MLKKVYEGRGQVTQKPKLQFEFPVRKIFFWWNLKNRIRIEVGTEPSTVGFENQKIIVKFATPIDKEKEEILNQIMKEEDPSRPPTHGSVLIIEDLEQNYYKLGGELFIGSSDGKVKDRIEIHYNQHLSSEDKERIIGQYKDLARFE